MHDYIERAVDMLNANPNARVVVIVASKEAQEAAFLEAVTLFGPRVKSTERPSHGLRLEDRDPPEFSLKFMLSGGPVIGCRFDALVIAGDAKVDELWFERMVHTRLMPSSPVVDLRAPPSA